MIENKSTCGKMTYWREGDAMPDDGRLGMEEFVGPKRLGETTDFKVFMEPFGFKMGSNVSKEMTLDLGLLGAVNETVLGLGPSFKYTYATGPQTNTVAMIRKDPRGTFIKYVNSMKIAKQRDPGGKFAHVSVEGTNLVSEYYTQKYQKPSKEVVAGDLVLPVVLKSAAYSVVKNIGPFIAGEVYSRVFSGYENELVLDFVEVPEFEEPEAEKSEVELLREQVSNLTKLVERLL